MDPCPFWTFQSYQMKMEVWVQQSTENPLIQTLTCSGTVITQYHQNIVWLVPSIIELKPFALALSCYNRKNNMYRKHSRDVNALYGLWTELRSNPKTQPKKKTRDTTKTDKNQKPYMVVPYYRGMSESLKKVCSRHGVQVYFKGGNTIKNLLVVQIDQDPIQKKSGVIYRYKCDRVDCDEEYIGESSRSFGERFKEHQKAPSPIFDHFNTTGHSIIIDNFSIVGCEDQYLNRTIKEALFIRVNNPSLNWDIGKFHLPHIWDEVPFNTAERKLNWTDPWLFPLPIDINTYHTHPPCSGYSICHLANNTYQTTVVTCNLCGFNIYPNIIRLQHLPSCYKRMKHLPCGNNICHHNII